jgi:uroporphyrinogen-III synthase
LKPLLVLRPEPGNGATAARAAALGLEVLQVPLFSTVAQPWTAPDPSAFDFLLLTSANAIRHGGDQLRKLTTLDVMAVGQATADAARAGGFHVRLTGGGGVEALLADVPSGARLLHLAGAHHRAAASRHDVKTIIVYRAEPLRVTLPRGPQVALVHSPRAGQRLAELATDRTAIAIAAISEQAAQACGEGWARVEAAATPADGPLLALAASLCQE